MPDISRCKTLKEELKEIVYERRELKNRNRRIEMCIISTKVNIKEIKYILRRKNEKGEARQQKKVRGIWNATA